jgi:hypothetical protein
MSDNFNQSLYAASREALIENGVPVEIAEAASVVVAKDDVGQPNLGRSPEDQLVVNQAMVHYWANQPDPEVTE